VDAIYTSVQFHTCAYIGVVA